LQALYNVSEKSHIPIEINFTADGFEVPCISSPSVNEEYQSYLAIIPGKALASIYERFGSRLLEQNVRSFLQFSGKINGGIRKTILTEPHMFLAFNNGIAATADEVEFKKSKDGNGMLLSVVKDLQIVNGGQTTASIYHTWKKDKADISNIFVQVKLSVVKNKDNFSMIVSRISEYANTQNKVSVSDLSSNRPYHIDFEKLSRSIYTPLSESNSIQTRWFYERARGQYKNARLKEGFTKSRQKAFDLKNPKPQMFTKEELAKYINAYEEITDGKKVIIGPHFVVRGNQKNYIQFVNNNLIKKLTNVYFEDTVAKAILFKAAEKAYGVIEAYIKKTAPGGLYGEWAKKEECWIQVKQHDFHFDLSSVKKDLIDKKNPPKRQLISEDETTQQQNVEEMEIIKSIPYSVWKKIEEYGRNMKCLSEQQCNIAFTIAGRVRQNTKITEVEKNTGLTILDIIISKAPEVLFDADEIADTEDAGKSKDPEITMELIKKMVSFDKQKKRLKPYQFRLMNEIANGKAELTPQNRKYCLLNFNTITKYGFKP
jgi:hypothetical protein